MSWRISSNRCSSRRWAMLRLLPVKKLSTQITSWPSARSRSQRCEPMKPAPPVTSIRMPLPLSAATVAVAPERDIAETSSLHPVRLVQVAAIHHNRALQGALDPLEIRVAILVPVGDDDQCVAVGQNLILISTVSDLVAKMFLRLLQGLRIVGTDRCPHVQQPFDDCKGRCFAHIVGTRLE